MLFKKKKVQEPIDERSEIEKKFEERGREIGAKTGEIVQKASEKVQTVKTKIKESDKVKKIQEKTQSKRTKKAEKNE